MTHHTPPGLQDFRFVLSTRALCRRWFFAIVKGAGAARGYVMRKALSLSTTTVVMAACLVVATPGPASASRLVSSWDSGLATLVAVGVDGQNSVFVYAPFSATINEFSKAGAAFGTIPRPGASSNDFDLDIAESGFTLGTGTVAAGDLFVTNGETVPQSLFGVNRAGTVTGQLDFPSGSLVGGSHHSARNSVFLVDYAGDIIKEYDPAGSGTLLNQFPVVPTGSTFPFDVFYGDVAVSPITGNLYIVSSSHPYVREMTPTGGFVRDYEVGSLGPLGMSGIDIDPVSGNAWIVTNQNGTVYEIALEPGPDDRVGCQTGDTCGTSGDDTLSANDGTIVGGAGDDTITGIIDADTTELIVDAGTGNDEIVLDIQDASAPLTVRVLAGGGADSISVPRSPGAVSPSLVAGDGNDVITVYAPSGSRRALAQGTATGRYVIDAGGGNDRVTSGITGDRIKLSLGNDTVDGGAGADTLDGGAGSDEVEGGTGNDSMLGGAGGDVLHGGDGTNDFNGGPGSDTCLSDTRRDRFSGCERVRRNHRRNHQAI
jgi:Ca2+-binding RTX toxin-like protein